jgi:hypothetical protein
MVYGQGHLSLEGLVTGQPPVVLQPMDLEGARCTTQEVNKSRRAVNGGELWALGVGFVDSIFSLLCNIG